MTVLLDSIDLLVLLPQIHGLQALDECLIKFQNDSINSFSDWRINKSVKFLSNIAHIFVNFTANQTKSFGKMAFR